MFHLLVPFIILFFLFIATVSLITKRYLIAGILFVVSFTINSYSECFSCNILKRDNEDVTNKDFSILSFNIHGSAINFENNVKQIADLIQHQNADLIFLTEYFPYCTDTLNFLLNACGYKYSLHSHEGNIILSKLPINTSEIIIRHPQRTKILKGSIILDNYPISIYGCHLSSNNYNLSDKQYLTPSNIGTIKTLFLYLKNISSVSQIRKEQAEAITHDFNGESIVVGDMNDICGSPALNQFNRAGLKNAWWTGGLGYGATIHKPLPYRIDHILYSDGLKLNYIRKIDSKELSDHDALLASFSINTK